MHDVCSSGFYFRNIPVYLKGHFAQILPVVRCGNRSVNINACIQHASL
jgi:hypothetical protein